MWIVCVFKYVLYNLWWLVILIPVVVLGWRRIDAWDVGVFSWVQKGQRSQCCIWNFKDLITLSVGVFPLRSTNPEILSYTSTLPFSHPIIPIYLPLWSTKILWEFGYTFLGLPVSWQCGVYLTVQIRIRHYANCTRKNTNPCCTELG